MIEPANRIKNLPAYVFAAIGQQIRALEAQGQHVIRLDIGVPDGTPPPAVIETLTTTAPQPHVHGYSSYAGTREFRAAVAAYYARRFNVTLDPNTQVLPLLGSKEGLVNLCLAYLNPGDMALIPDLSYPVYGRGIMLAEAEACQLSLTPQNDFLPDLQAIPEVDADRAKMLWLNYPNNPTGAVADLTYFQQAVDFCNAHDILLVSDNPYVELTFDGYQAGSALQAADSLNCCIEFMTLSKSFNMAGWRLGAAVGNPAAINILLQMKSNVDTGHFIPIYEAGITALEHTPVTWMNTHRQIYQQRRDWVMDALPAIGLKARKPQGAMFVWAEVEEGTGQSYVEEALEHAHVSLTPGQAFGPGAARYVRISLGMQDDQLQLALERLKDWFLAR